MATIYKRRYKRPIPPGAEIITRRERRLVRYKDRAGVTQTAEPSDDGRGMWVEDPAWTIVYHDAKGRRRMVKGYTDHEATVQKAARLDKESARAVEGMTHADPEKAKGKLSDAVSAWVADLQRSGRDSMYIYNCRRVMTRLSEECGWTTPASIQPDAMTKWLSTAAAGGRQKKKGRAPRTVNEYLDTAKTFLNWCVVQGYLDSNSLSGVSPARVLEKKRVRRC